MGLVLRGGVGLIEVWSGVAGDAIRLWRPRWSTGQDGSDGRTLLHLFISHMMAKADFEFRP